MSEQLKLDFENDIGIIKSVIDTFLNAGVMMEKKVACEIVGSPLYKQLIIVDKLYSKVERTSHNRIIRKLALFTSYALSDISTIKYDRYETYINSMYFLLDLAHTCIMTIQQKTQNIDESAIYVDKIVSRYFNIREEMVRIDNAKESIEHIYVNISIPINNAIRSAIESMAYGEGVNTGIHVIDKIFTTKDAKRIASYFKEIIDNNDSINDTTDNGETIGDTIISDIMSNVIYRKEVITE